MSARDRERAIVRKLRESLGLSRDDFAALVTQKGLKISAANVEAYEKEIPESSIDVLVALAREKHLDAIAEELRPTINKTPAAFSEANRIWHMRLEEILAEPSERVGIEKNLLWAVDSIRGRKGPRRKAG